MSSVQNNLQNNVTLFLLFLYFIIYPFFFFTSGLPQIADFILSLIFGINIFRILPMYKISNFSKIVTSLLIYTCLINLFWGIVYEDKSIYFNIFYYFYNLFVFLLTLFLLRNVNNYYKIVPYGLLISYIVQLFAVPFGRESGIRNIIFFNNPNQLGLWAILTFFIIYLYYQSKLLKGYYFLIAIFLSCYFVVLSISKASIITFSIFLFYFVTMNFKKSILPLLIGVSFLTYSIHSLEIKLDDIEFLVNLVERLETDSSADDSLGGRGYDRIWNHPFYNILGSGEGGNYRFKSEWYGEIHSALGTMLFCYGLFGFFSFIYIMYMIWKKNELKIYIVMLLINIYMTVHLGLRSAFLWMLLAHLYYYKNYLTNSRSICVE